MKVVILAAGVGSRLGEADVPKPLTPLATGQSILEYQLDVLRKYTSLENVIVVVGYRKEDIMQCFPNLMFVYNPDYALENTAKSLLRGLRKINEDVLWLNGDVVMHPNVLQVILQRPRTSMIVNIGPVGEEEVKYRQDSKGQILVVSKQVEDPQGEALGINYFLKKDLEVLCKGLEACNDKDYFERGIEFCIQRGVSVWSSVVESTACAEIDFPEDLIKVNHMLRNWQ